MAADTYGFINPLNGEDIPEYLYIGETKIEHTLVERIEHGNDIELHVKYKEIFHINQRIFFGIGRDSFRSFYSTSAGYNISDDYQVVKGEFDRCIHFPKSFLKEYCKYIDLDIYLKGKHFKGFEISNGHYQYYKRCLEESKHQQHIDKNCPFETKCGDKYGCKLCVGLTTAPCDDWENCYRIRNKDEIIKHNEEKDVTADEAIKKIIDENVKYLYNNEIDKSDGNDTVLVREKLNVETYACQCGYIEYGNIPNFCAKCGQRFKTPQPVFDLIKPTLIDLDPIEIKQFKELDGFGLQDKLMMKRCAKCDHSHDFDWDKSKTFECGEYNEFKIDINLAKTKQCLCYSSKNRKVCPKCNHAFDAYSKSNNYKSERECPFCHQYKYEEYREKHFSIGATIFTLFMWILPLLLAIFLDKFAVLSYMLTLGLWGITIGDCEGLGVFTTYEDLEEWNSNESDITK